jgi:hypothetical protein
MRQESAETQLHEQKGANAVLQRLLEEHKRNVEELTEQLRTTKVNVQQLTGEVRNRNSQVMQLEADKFFMSGDLKERFIVEEELRKQGMQLQLRVDQLIKLEKESSDRLKDEMKRKDKERKYET